MNRKILIVDDELPIRRLLEKMFSNEYEVFSAADAFEAQDIIKANDISLVISDQRMPGQTGVQLFEKMRLLYPHITRILLSGYIEKNDLQYAIENEIIHHFVAKPWSVKEMKILVAEAPETQEMQAVEKEPLTV